MKYAFMSFSSPGASLDDLLRMAREYGYDGIEPRVEVGHGHGISLELTIEEAARIRTRCEAAGVALACMATSCRFAEPDPAARGKVVDTARRYLRLASLLGIPAIRVFGGPYPATTSREKAMEALADGLKQLAPEAEERRIYLCLETHDSWCDPAHVRTVMEMVHAPFIGVNWDIMHPVITAGKTVDEAYAQLKSWIRHVHLHDGKRDPDGKLVMIPIGAGVVDHRRALKLLKTGGYEEYLSGEWINWEPAETHLPREIAVLRQYEKEI